MPLGRSAPAAAQTGRGSVLYKVIAILVLLWLAGLATFIMLGGLIHLLLIIALFIFVVEFMTAKSA
nr:lmo0937 family membrane protein [Erythrobacter ramosus]